MDARPIVTTAAELRKYIKWCLFSHQRLLISGPPGVGKSCLVNDIVKTLVKDGTCHTLLGSLSDPTDLAGFPVSGAEVQDSSGAKHNVIKFAPRSFLVELNDKSGVLFLDELTSCPPSVLAVMLRGLSEMVFGEYKLDPERVGIVAACNSAEAAVNGTELPGPISNRLVQIEYPITPESISEWCSDVVYNWGSPLGALKFNGHVITEARRIQARSYVANFIKRKPDQFFNFPKDETSRAKPFPTARSWTNAAEVLACVLTEGEEPEEALPLIAGLIGDGAAAEFSTMLRLADLPDPEEILQDPNKYHPSGRPDVDGAAVDGVVACVIAKPTDARLLAATKVVLEKCLEDGTFQSVEVVMPGYTKLQAFIQSLAGKPEKDRPFTNDTLLKWQAQRSAVNDRIVTARNKITAKKKK